MAGDWIKFEHATLDKPETMRGAEMLGISRDEMVGLLIRYFVWLDKTLSGFCPDFVRHVSEKSLDEIMRCPGFAGTLKAVGWATWDEDGWTLRVINADRHNGTPAKSRALDNRRKQKDRRILSESCPDSNRNKTGPEKRREESNSLPNGKEYAGARLAKDWKVPDEWLQEAGRLRPEWTEAERRFVADGFRDHWIAKPGKDGRKVDWFATWCNWCRNQRPLNKSPSGGTKQAHRNQFFDTIYGRTDTEKPIEGTAERVVD